MGVCIWKLTSFINDPSTIETYEGMPEPYDKKKRVVVPDALRVLRMRADRNFTLLGALAKEFGWGYTEMVQKLDTEKD